MKEATSLVPIQQEGATSDTTAKKECMNTEHAKSFFVKVKQRILDVNQWESFAGFASADFKLCDERGEEVNRAAQLHDHFRIDVPGPGSITGGGYDWVQVETIEEISEADEERLAITVRPATNPKNENKDVAHFFSDKATSSFIIERKGTIITAGVHGRNEKPNADAEKIIDKARNTAVASAAITAFSKVQWQGLVDGLLKEENN